MVIEFYKCFAVFFFFRSCFLFIYFVCTFKTISVVNLFWMKYTLNAVIQIYLKTLLFLVWLFILFYILRIFILFLFWVPHKIKFNCINFQWTSLFDFQYERLKQRPTTKIEQNSEIVFSSHKMPHPFFFLTPPTPNPPGHCPLVVLCLQFSCKYFRQTAVEFVFAPNPRNKVNAKQRKI